MFRLLCITAHPDDEAGGFGGTLLKCHDRGIETHVVCMTPGQAARHRGGAKSDAELSALRRDEFQAACQTLRVSSGEVLDYPDAGLPLVHFLDAAGAVVARIRRIRPHVLVTFGPEGGLTGHPDHAMAGLWATAAFQWAARPDRFPEQAAQGLAPHRAQKLYYATALFSLEKRPPVALAPVTAIVDIAPYVQRKFEAFRRHTTQAPLFELFENNVARHGREEFFHLAASVSPRKVAMETDLFEGVKEEG